MRGTAACTEDGRLIVVAATGWGARTFSATIAHVDAPSGALHVDASFDVLPFTSVCEGTVTLAALERVSSRLHVGGARVFALFAVEHASGRLQFELGHVDTEFRVYEHVGAFDALLGLTLSQLGREADMAVSCFGRHASLTHGPSVCVHDLDKEGGHTGGIGGEEVKFRTLCIASIEPCENRSNSASPSTSPLWTRRGPDPHQANDGFGVEDQNGDVHMADAPKGIEGPKSEHELIVREFEGISAHSKLLCFFAPLCRTLLESLGLSGGCAPAMALLSISAATVGGKGAWRLLCAYDMEDKGLYSEEDEQSEFDNDEEAVEGTLVPPWWVGVSEATACAEWAAIVTGLDPKLARSTTSAAPVSWPNACTAQARTSKRLDFKIASEWRPVCTPGSYAVALLLGLENCSVLLLGAPTQPGGRCELLRVFGGLDGVPLYLGGLHWSNLDANSNSDVGHDASSLEPLACALCLPRRVDVGGLETYGGNGDDNGSASIDVSRSGLRLTLLRLLADCGGSAERVSAPSLLDGCAPMQKPLIADWLAPQVSSILILSRCGVAGKLAPSAMGTLVNIRESAIRLPGAPDSRVPDSAGEKAAWVSYVPTAVFVADSGDETTQQMASGVAADRANRLGQLYAAMRARVRNGAIAIRAAGSETEGAILFGQLARAALAEPGPLRDARATAVHAQWARRVGLRRLVLPKPTPSTAAKIPPVVEQAPSGQVEVPPAVRVRASGGGWRVAGGLLVVESTLSVSVESAAFAPSQWSILPRNTHDNNSSSNGNNTKRNTGGRQTAFVHIAVGAMLTLNTNGESGIERESGRESEDAVWSVLEGAGQVAGAGIEDQSLEGGLRGVPRPVRQLECVSASDVVEFQLVFRGVEPARGEQSERERGSGRASPLEGSSGDFAGWGGGSNSAGDEVSAPTLVVIQLPAVACRTAGLIVELVATWTVEQAEEFPKQEIPVLRVLPVATVTISATELERAIRADSRACIGSESRLPSLLPFPFCAQLELLIAPADTDESDAAAIWRALRTLPRVLASTLELSATSAVEFEKAAILQLRGYSRVDRCELTLSVNPLHGALGCSLAARGLRAQDAALRALSSLLAPAEGVSEQFTIRPDPMGALTWAAIEAAREALTFEIDGAVSSLDRLEAQISASLGKEGLAAVGELGWHAALGAYIQQAVAAAARSDECVARVAQLHDAWHSPGLLR